jgi:uncharacterized damage-inducible protein DinB
MIPPRIRESFKALPNELVGLCRPHAWADLTAPPREGMRSIRDVLVHMIGTEANWVGYVIQGRPRRRSDPESFESLDAILTAWTPQRAATLEFVDGLSPEGRVERRPFPWDASQTATVEEVIWHVVTHDQYHRGQIFTRLALLGRRDLPDIDMLR